MSIRIRIVIFFLGLIGSLNCFADSAWDVPVRRKTINAEADLIDALIKRNRFDDAVQICKSELQIADPETDRAAIWTIRLSEVLAAKQLMTPSFDNAAIIAAQQPIADLMNAKPDHSRTVFLKAQKLAVKRESARHAVVIASVNPTDAPTREKVSTVLARTTSDIKEMIESVSQERVRLDSNLNSPRNQSLRIDIQRLQQELQVDVVGLALLQTSLFEPKTKDYISAANRAEQAAEEALVQLPADTKANLEVRRLRVKAMLLGEKITDAATELGLLARACGRPLPAEIMALRIQIDLAEDQVSQAEKRITTIDRAGLASIELDLARLQIMLARKNPKVGNWLDEIEKRHGAFARRRAESIALARLRSSGLAENIDASIVAAQGQDWLRRGDPLRAGQLLSAAAEAEQDSGRAISRATEAAAAFVKANKPVDAANILSRISLSKKDDAGAPTAHLQAALLLAQAKAPRDTLVVRLRAILGNWPATKQADQARNWLTKIMIAEKKWIDAAKDASSLPSAGATSQQLQTAADLWTQAALKSEDSAMTDLGRVFTESFSQLQGPQAESMYRKTAAIVLDEQFLSSVQPAGDDYGDQLLKYRKSPGSALEQPPSEWQERTVWRLMRDAEMNSVWRKLNAKLIQNWNVNHSATLQAAQRQIWLGDVVGATKAVDSMIQSGQSGKLLSDAARLFGRSDNASARSQAIKYWDRLASGVQRGSSAWHEAKLAAIELLAKTNQQAEAARRAKYVLLTSPPADAQIKRRYQTASDQKP